jgi:hypothetical protein
LDLAFLVLLPILFLSFLGHIYVKLVLSLISLLNYFKNRLLKIS